MGEFLVWLLVSSLTMLVLYGVYAVLLSRLRQPAFNRAVLLTIYALSFLSLPLYGLFDRPTSAGEPIRVAGVYSAPVSDLLMMKTWLHIIFWIYVAGVAVMLIRRIYGQLAMMNIIVKGEHIRKSGYTLVIDNASTVSPFSWRKYIVMSRKDLDSDADIIIVHELSHLKSLHWIDLIIADFALIIQWFNPVAWMMRDELKDIHEFQADANVISSGYDLKSYQLMLIGKVVGQKIYYVGNNLNHGKLKRRVSMMISRPAGLLTRLRAVLLIPAFFALAVCANSQPVKSFFRQIAGATRLNIPQRQTVTPSKADLPTVFVNGKEVEYDDINDIDPSQIKNVVVRKAEGINGTIYLETK